MQDQGFNGTGSRFNSRFEAGSPIYAKQLNDLATGVQAGLPQPYVGYGPSVSFTPGGAVIAGVWDDNVGGASPICPGQIYNLRYDVDADKYYINITPFHINGLIVTDYDDNPLTDLPPPDIQVFTAGISTDSENPTVNYIYVICEASDATAEAIYPVDDPPPYIFVSTNTETDTNDMAHFLIGIVTGWTNAETDVDTLTIQNFKSCGSLMTARLMCGSGPPTYFWSAV